jgi:hypothetical protein
LVLVVVAVVVCSDSGLFSVVVDVDVVAMFVDLVVVAAVVWQ